jgi:hypothetical protein
MFQRFSNFKYQTFKPKPCLPKPFSIPTKNELKSPKDLSKEICSIIYFHRGAFLIDSRLLSNNKFISILQPYADFSFSLSSQMGHKLWAILCVAFDDDGRTINNITILTGARRKILFTSSYAHTLL